MGKPDSYSSVQDSGKRQEFKTGSVRDTQEGKGRYDLVDDYALERIALHYEHGCVKYGDSNWRRGQPLSRYLSSAKRHLSRWSRGKRGEIELKEDHLAAAAWNIFSIIWTEEQVRLGKLTQELDDMNVVGVQSRAGPIRMGTEAALWGKEAVRQRESRLYVLANQDGPWIPVWHKPRTLWQRFLARIGM